MRLKILLYAAAIFFNSVVSAKTANVKVLNENISILLKVSGDLTGEYSLAGPINTTLEADSDTSNSKCSVSVLFRKVKIKQKNSVEAWPTLICTIEGQKQTFKLNRSYLDVDLESQKVEVKYLSQDIKILTLEFRDLSLQKSK